MTISEQTIRHIKDNATLVQAIEYYTGQQPVRGRYLCPFHPDRHPSLTVKGCLWKCWSCGEHGDVIDFVMKYFGIGFKETVCKLNEDFGLGIELEKHVSADPAERLWEQIRIECSEYNKQQVAEYRQRITNQIDTLTICHRVLMQQGASADILNGYIRGIDDLIEEEEFWR